MKPQGDDLCGFLFLQGGDYFTTEDTEGKTTEATKKNLDYRGHIQYFSVSSVVEKSSAIIRVE